jgi:mono/diheme cytochrome c family protein
MAGLCSLVGTMLAGGSGGSGVQKLPAHPVFERDIRPIFKAHCFHCHGEEEKPKGGVDLRQRRLLLNRSESGPVLVPGKPGQSHLLSVLKSGEMPKGGKPLSAEQVTLIERWIAQGAPTLRPEPVEVPRWVITEEERQFWAFQPVGCPEPPRVRLDKTVRTPIDAFLLARLKKEGLGFAKPAKPEQLIRRLTLDLTGLPPTPEEVDAFVADPSDAAYERWVDRLLDKPAYGERWGRHWLDVAGYADSNGGVEADSERPWAWRYRDYVIRAFNDDRPFDEFITEQLAGDELLPAVSNDLSGRDLDRLVATGFLRMAPDPTGDGPPEPELARNQVIADTLQIVSSSLLGLTVHCAQCHDHRYDPIPQADYYRLRAVFEPAFDWKRWKNPAQRLVSLMPSVDRSLADCVEQAAKVHDAEATRLHDELIEKFVQKQLLLVPEARREAVIGARRTPAAKRSPEQLQLLREFPMFQDHIILGEIDREGANKVDEIRKRATADRALKPSDPMVQALVEAPAEAVTTVRFHRGDPQQPREVLNPGLLSVMGLGGLETEIPESIPGRRTSGRRLELARRLTDRNNPLTARVWVNRLWHEHFGMGLVATPGDFGALGERPSHPELLDWLAAEFMDHGWKSKRLHRLIVTSAAYRQGTVNAAAQKKDPDNRLLGRFRLRRLDAESLRDSLLAVSGRLDATRFGPPVPIAVNAQGQFVVGRQKRDGNGDAVGVETGGTADFRRSVYVTVRRTMPVGVLETFDAPVVNPNCEARPVSTAAPQSLMFLNDGFVLDRALDLAQRLRREAPGDERAQLARLWRLLFLQSPTSADVDRSRRFLQELQASLPSSDSNPLAKASVPSTPETAAVTPEERALAALCQVLMGSNRFLYLD